jgi:hypothetical protein
MAATTPGTITPVGVAACCTGAAAIRGAGAAQAASSARPQKPGAMPISGCNFAKFRSPECEARQHRIGAANLLPCNPALNQRQMTRFFVAKISVFA